MGDFCADDGLEAMEDLLSVVKTDHGSDPTDDSRDDGNACMDGMILVRWIFMLLCGYRGRMVVEFVCFSFLEKCGCPVRFSSRLIFLVSFHFNECTFEIEIEN